MQPAFVELVTEARNDRPYGESQAQMLMDLLLLLGRKDEALNVAREKEFEALVNTANDRRFAAAHLLNVGLIAEYIDRIKVRRALGRPLDEDDCWLLSNAIDNEAEAIEVLRQGVEVNPNSYKLRAHLGVLLHKEGHQAEAQSMAGPGL